MSRRRRAVKTFPRALLLILGLALAVLPDGTRCLAAAQSAQPQSARPQGSSETDCYRVESKKFVFHSDPWINLHHFLFQWSRNVPERQPNDRRRAVEVPESAQVADLSETGRQSWRQALDLYRERLIRSDLLFGRDLIALRGRLAAIACSADGAPKSDSNIDDDLRAVLAEVDVTAYANWSGAYTTNGPDHATIETSYKGLEGLETLFHEVSHASVFEQRILGQIAAAFGPLEADPPGRLSHAIQFATPAEILRSLLSAGEQASYRSVAEQVNERGPFRDQYRIVLKHWKPFLEGNIERADALAGIAREITAN